MCYIDISPLVWIVKYKFTQCQVGHNHAKLINDLCGYFTIHAINVGIQVNIGSLS